MTKKQIWIVFLMLAVCLLAGCSMLTVDQMYCLPKRSESYNNLQAAIDKAMLGMEYCAPLSGENQQTVQTADLDGDGVGEYLVFARSTDGDRPLHILVFQQDGDNYILTDSIDSNGTGFELVEYIPMDDSAGVEMVVGSQISNQLVRSASVYTFQNGSAELLVTMNYTKLLACDLDTDSRKELMIIRPGLSEGDNGIAELYEIENGSVERSKEASISESADRLKRIITGKLHGGTPAVFVGSSVEDSAIITDIYAVVDGVFTNVSLSSESGTSVQTLRNYYVYADDIDADGEVELPNLITADPPEGKISAGQQHLIRWYAMGTDGSEANKMYTYHNFMGGWYLELDAMWATRIYVAQEENGFAFYLRDEGASSSQRIFTVFALTGQNREEQALQENRFVLYRGESVIYAAHLDVASGELSIAKEDLISSFHLIHQDWKTGEM